jgi:ribosomal protein S18 acetylase RimI-like enzyme
MQIRPATAADIPVLNVLVNSAYRGDGSKQGWTTEADLLDGIRTSEASLRDMINHPDAVILVLEDGAVIDACVYLEKRGEALYLGMLTVRPDLQAKGFGGLLLKAAEERASELGCTAIQMSVLTARDSLIAFYKRKGFEDTGERLPFPNDPKFGIPKQPLQFMIMKKTLPASSPSIG